GKNDAAHLRMLLKLGESFAELRVWSVLHDEAETGAAGFGKGALEHRPTYGAVRFFFLPPSRPVLDLQITQEFRFLPRQLQRRRRRPDERAFAANLDQQPFVLELLGGQADGFATNAELLRKIDFRRQPAPGPATIGDGPTKKLFDLSGES